jgi:hypothetical protein
MFVRFRDSAILALVGDYCVLFGSRIEVVFSKCLAFVCFRKAKVIGS